MAQQRRTIKKETKPAPKPVEEKAKKSSLPSSTKKEIAFITLFFSSILLILGIYGTDLLSDDSASTVGSITGSSIIGHLGVIIKWIFSGLLGPVAYLLPVLCIAAGLYIAKTRNQEKSKSFVYISGVIFTICVSALFYTFQYVTKDTAFSFSDFWNFGTLSFGGGVLGALLGYPLVFLAKQTGASIIIIAIMLISFIAMTDFAITKKTASVVRKAKAAEEKRSADVSSDELKSVEEIIHPVTEEVPKKKKRNRFTDAAEDIVPLDSDKDTYVSLAEEIEKLPRTGEKIQPDAEIKIYTEQKKEKEIKPFAPPEQNIKTDEIILSSDRIV